jgi:kynurenine formamidase
MKLIDLTHTFTDNMPVFPGDPDATLKQSVFIEKEGNNDHTLTTAMHVGTHIDAPLHMISDGKRIDQLDLDQFLGTGILVDARGKKKIDIDLLENKVIPAHAIVLILTGRDKHFGTEDYFSKYPEITQDFAQTMIDHNVNIVGIDTASPEHNPPWDIHKMLLRNNILILENLTNLEKLLNVKEFEVIALPPKLHSDASPVRVIAKSTSDTQE